MLIEKKKKKGVYQQKKGLGDPWVTQKTQLKEQFYSESPCSGF